MFRTNPGTWKPGVFWERICAEIAQNRTKPPKIAENRLVRSLEPPEQLGCVPGSEHYLKSALVRLEFGDLAQNHVCFGDLAKSQTVLQVLQIKTEQTRH